MLQLSATLFFFFFLSFFLVFLFPIFLSFLPWETGQLQLDFLPPEPDFGFFLLIAFILPLALDWQGVK